MTDKEAMKMVLDKLDHIWELGVEVETYRLSDDLLPEMKALRQQLSQPAWIGLTDTEVIEISKATSVYGSDNHYEVMEFVASIEAKLKEKNT